MLESLREAIAPVSLALSQEGTLIREGIEHAVRLNPHKVPRPTIADEAKFRMHLDGDLEPQQNDLIVFNGSNPWVVWKVTPSPLNTHAMLDCVAQPSDLATPIIVTRISDGMGGYRSEETPAVDDAFLVTVTNSTAQYQLTAPSDMVGRIMIHFKSTDAPANFAPGNRIRVHGENYTTLNVELDQTNMQWSRALLVKE